MAQGRRGMRVAELAIVRSLLVLVFMVGCAGAHREITPPSPSTSTSPARLAWLRAEVARADQLTQRLRGSYVPRGAPGAAAVCSLAIEIESWYGVGDERWELMNASSSMMPARRSLNIREELARIGIRDCVLDVDR
jgi:hypothetical protein